MGFRFAEVMSGSYALATAPERERPIAFDIRVRSRSLLGHLRHGRADLAGTLRMEGFADGVPIAGTITISPIRRKLIRYEFSFIANNGRRYRFEGQKDIEFGNLRQSITTLPGAVYDTEGASVARADLRFELDSELLPFLASWRPA